MADAVSLDYSLRFNSIRFGRGGRDEFAVSFGWPARPDPMLTLVLSTASLAAFVLAAPHLAGTGQPHTRGTEKHLRNVRQLTFGGENAEAYFSADGSRLIFQSTRQGVPCDQIFTMKTDGSELKRVSTGTGRTTCGYFYPSGTDIVFASTHEASAACPPRPDFSRGYVWPIYDGYEIYRAKADGTGLTKLTNSPGYDAEATVAPDGLITFTS